ncbi:hypothetical protein V8E52_010962 [Russula decolorans]
MTSPPLGIFTSAIMSSSSLSGVNVPPTSSTTPPPSSSTPPPHSVATTSGGTHFAVAPGGARLSVCTLTGVSWPETLILDLGKSNWASSLGSTTLSLVLI